MEGIYGEYLWKVSVEKFSSLGYLFSCFEGDFGPKSIPVKNLSYQIPKFANLGIPDGIFFTEILLEYFLTTIKGGTVSREQLFLHRYPDKSLHYPTVLVLSLRCAFYMVWIQFRTQKRQL